MNINNALSDTIDINAAVGISAHGNGASQYSKLENVVNRPQSPAGLKDPDNSPENKALNVQNVRQATLDEPNVNHMETANESDGQTIPIIESWRKCFQEGISVDELAEQHVIHRNGKTFEKMKSVFFEFHHVAERVKNGESCIDIAESIGIKGDHDAARDLFLLALDKGPAKQDIRNGGHVKNVMDKYGISDRQLHIIESLEQLALDEGPAGKGVQGGEALKEIADKYGISTLGNVYFKLQNQRAGDIHKRAVDDEALKENVGQYAKEYLANFMEKHSISSGTDKIPIPYITELVRELLLKSKFLTESR